MAAGCGDDDPTPPGTGSLPPLPDHQPCSFAGTAPGFVPPGSPTTFAQVPGTAPVVALRTDARDVVVALTEDGVLHELPRGGEPSVLLDISDQVSTAFDFAIGEAHLFVAHAPTSRPESLRITRFTRTGGAIDASSAFSMMEFDTPLGGTVALESERYLYVGVGDVDPEGLERTAMDRADLRGKILRLDVADPSAPGGYTTPSDNPIRIADAPSLLFATGVRAPRSLSIGADGAPITFVDHGIVNDELDVLLPARSYGWPDLDGRTCYRAVGSCSPFAFEGPNFLLARTEDSCGLVAGARIGQGAYDGGMLYGDACATGLSGFLFNGYRVLRQSVARLPASVSAIGHGTEGGVLVADTEGTVHEITARDDEPPFPVTLSESGCFTDLASLTPAPGVVPYELNAPLFTDGSHKQRFIALPAGTSLGIDAEGALVYPPGSTILKLFSYDQPLEARVLYLGEDGWEAHSYRFDADASEAYLVEASEEVDVAVMLPGGPATAHHLLPDRQGCAVCHGFRPQLPVGPRLEQLARVVELDGGPAQQLEAFAAIGLFGGATLPAVAPMPDPLDSSADLEDRARAYLHTNCSHCHRPGGWVPPDLHMDFRWGTALAEMEACGVPSDYAPLPVDRLTPGDPDASLLYLRMTSDDVERMPPLGVSLPDDEGSGVVREWIESLASCE